MFSASVGNQFRKQLDSLMRKINETTPYFIRCINPNKQKKPRLYNGIAVVDQLRCGGVIEAVRITKNMYPTHVPHRDFYERFTIPWEWQCILARAAKGKKFYNLPITATIDEIYNACKELLIALGLRNPEDYQLGRSLVFFRVGMIAKLETRLLDYLYNSSTLIRKVYLKWHHRTKFKKQRKAAILLQKNLKGMIARIKYKTMRETTAASKIQKLYRKKKMIKGFRNVVYLVLRQHLMEKRRLALEKRRQEAIIIIQKWTKRWLARLHYKRLKKSMIALQSHFRGKRIRKYNKIQKGEAMAVAKMRLEKELKETQEKLVQVTQEKTNTEQKLSQTTVQLTTEKTNVKEKADNVTKLEGQLSDVTSKYTQLKQVASLEEISKAELAGELETIKKNFENVVNDLEKTEKSLAQRNNDYYILDQQKKETT